MEDVVKKRILLAKEFYLNGVELAIAKDPLSKMIAIHNFHIAVEIAIKSILLKYEIRSDKTLNIDFESMINEVDKHKLFQEKKLRLPYRQELRNLNQIRNLVQHHAMEPDENSMDDWRFFLTRFLSQVFEEYFDINIDNINRISFVNDNGLKKYLEVASNYYANGKYDLASCYAAAAFEYAAISISDFIPNLSASFFISASLDKSFSELQNAFKDTHKRIDQSEHFSALLASGLNLRDYKKYKDSSPIVMIMAYGNPTFQTFDEKEFSKDSSSWLIDFVVSTIVKWQQIGLSPKIRPLNLSGAIEHIDEEIKKIDAQP
jgi:hypothetical protein